MIRIELAQAGVIPIGEVAPDFADAGERKYRLSKYKEKLISVAGLVVARQRPETAKGVVFITLEDETGRVHCIVAPDLWDQLKPVLKEGALILTGVVQQVSTALPSAWKGLQVRGAVVLDLDVPVGMVGDPGAVARP